MVLVLAVPALIPLLESLLRRPPGIAAGAQLRVLGADFRLATARWGLVNMFLADQAWLMGDAIGRTLVRLAITHRNMLQWVPAAQLADAMVLDTRGFYRRMPGAVILAIIGIAVAVAGGEATWPLALAFGLLWLESPALACRISTPPVLPQRLTLGADDISTLRLIARRTWPPMWPTRYFPDCTSKQNALQAHTRCWHGAGNGAQLSAKHGQPT